MSEKQLIEKLNIYIKQHRNDRNNIDLYNHVNNIKDRLHKYRDIKQDIHDKKQQTSLISAIESRIPPLHRIIFYYREECQPCNEQKKYWNKVVENIKMKKNIDIFKIKKTKTDGVKTYPCNKIYKSDGSVYIFNNDKSYNERNVDTLTSFFLKHL